MATKPLPLEFYFNGPIVDPKTGHATEAFKAYFSKNIELKTATSLNLNGQLVSTDVIAADGAGSPLAGGRRGFVALDSNSRLTDSFRENALNVSLSPTSATVLSNDGVSHTIMIAAETVQFGPGQISYNSGSVDPGAFGGIVVYADDPTFTGGAVGYQFTTTAAVQVADDARLPFGGIVTSGGTPHTGGGDTGGDTPGGEGGRGLILI